jgi:FkbM family methyltransferase
MNQPERLPRMPRYYQLLRRFGLLIARFFGAAANLGLVEALRLYCFELWGDGDTSVWVPPLAARVHFRGKSDYLVLTLLFTDNFNVESVGSDIRTIIDLGANIGIETLRFAAFHPEARIIAVEADGDNYRVLRQNTADLAQVTALHAAAWGTKSRFQIKKNPDSNMASTVAVAPIGEIPGVTIQELIDQLGVSQLDILKIDVEGAEDSLFGPNIADWIGRVRVIVWELNDHEAPNALSRLVLAMNRAGVQFNFHIRGEKLVCIRTDIAIAVRYPCGLVS